MKENNLMENEFMDIPEVKKSVFERIKNWFELKKNSISEHNKSMLKTVLSGIITSTAIAGTLITASMAFTIGLLPTLAITSCYVAATMMSSYILREEINKLKGNIVLKNIEIKEKDKEELDVPEVKESKIEKITKSLKERFSKKQEEIVEEKEEIELDIPEVKESKIEKITKSLKERFSKKKENNLEEKEELDISMVKESKISKIFNLVKEGVNKMKSRKKKRKTLISKIGAAIGSLGYLILAILSASCVTGILGLSAIFGFGLTALVTVVGAVVFGGCFCKIHDNLSYIVTSEEEIEFDEEFDVAEELERTQTLLKNLNINSEADIDKAKLVEEEKLGTVKEEVKQIEMKETIISPEATIEIVEEEPKKLSLTK